MMTPALIDFIPDDILKYILDLLLDGNLNETSFYVLVSRRFLEIIRIAISNHITAIKTNPVLVILYGEALLQQKPSALIPFINYSSEYEMNLEHFFKQFFYFLRVFSFSPSVPKKLRSESRLILKQYLRGTEKIQSSTNLMDKHFWFPAVYEFALNNLDNVEILLLCSKYFGYPEKFVSFLFCTVPKNMKDFLIPYDQKEYERLLRVMNQNFRWHRFMVISTTSFWASLR